MILWINAKFYTLEDKETYTNKVLTNNGKILALGEDTLKYKHNKTIDLNGSFVFPGFSEAHMHLIGLGRKLSGNVLINKTNKNSILKEIKSFYNNTKLLVEGYFDQGIINTDLDLISTSEYIVLRHNDYHSFTVNSKVLSDLNIFNSNGIIKDEKVTPLVKTIWETNNKETLELFTKKAVKHLIENGFVSSHTDDLSYFNSYTETSLILKEVSNTPFRINALIHHDIIDEYIKYFPKDKYFNDIQIKLFYDGTISSKTALLNDYYSNTINNGVRNMEESEFLKYIKLSRKLNKGLAIHSIGDKATDEILYYLEKNKKADEMDRIVHGSLLSDIALKNIKDIAIDIQPLFKITDKKIIEKNINHKVNVYPFKELINASLLINLSSDAPVEDINPLLNMYVLNDIDRYELIKGYTINPNQTINIKAGLIKEGYLADFTCFDKDILNIENDKLLKTSVTYTVIDEVIVYKK